MLVVAAWAGGREAVSCKVSQWQCMMEDGGGHTEQVQILHGVDTADVEYRYCDMFIKYLHSTYEDCKTF